MKRILIGCGAACLVLAITSAQAADDSGCQPVMDALAKLGETPNRQYMVITSAAGGGGVREAETICVGDIAYIKVQGKWTAGPMTPKQIARQQQENIRSARVYNCRYDRDQKIDGDMTAVYKAHSENEDGVEDAEIWISKARGLIVREAVESNGGETHMSARFVYTNVKPPSTK